MGESKHTPGPWSVERDTAGATVAVEAGSKQVADCWSLNSDGVSRGEMLANAHLIAAAPDLYTACEALSKELRDLLSGAESDALNLADAALAKAVPQ